MTDPDRISEALEAAVALSRQSSEGAPAAYIPALARAPAEATSAAIELKDGTCVTAGDAALHRFTLQSTAKLILLAGLLEERGEEAVFEVVGTEPSERGFASLARLEHDPRPANPLINAGAIALCGQLEGNLETRLGWIEHWTEQIYGRPLPIASRVLVSERRTAGRNRAIAYLLAEAGVFEGPVEEVLESYISLCALETTVSEAVKLPGLLARGGLRADGERVLSPRTVACMVALMSTCGMYDESGAYLVTTGMPAKSGVSGVIVAVALGQAGVVVANPRLNAKGGSVRGHIILRALSSSLGWHLARSPGSEVPTGG